MVGEVELHTRARLVDVLVEGRREVGLAELHAGQVQLAQCVGPVIVDVRRPDQLERPGGAPALGQVGALEHAGARIDDAVSRPGMLGDGGTQGRSERFGRQVAGPART